jgi:hypothetical protein
VGILPQPAFLQFHRVLPVPVAIPDLGALAQRLAQNGVQEKLTALWIGRCPKQVPPPAERKAA